MQEALEKVFDGCTLLHYQLNQYSSSYVSSWQRSAYLRVTGEHIRVTEWKQADQVSEEEKTQRGNRMMDSLVCVDAGSKYCILVIRDKNAFSSS